MDLLASPLVLSAQAFENVLAVAPRARYAAVPGG
jgi:hypothetical protein